MFLESGFFLTVKERPMSATLSAKSVRERITHFMHLEASGGIVLMFVALIALVANNSLLASGYQGFLNTPVAIQFGDFKIAKPALLWINDGLMAIFFFLVGLEIKREVLAGELSSLDKTLSPCLPQSEALLFQR